MQKIVLIDGNNLLFRSYYATAYNGNFMKNSKGFPTNALFGFINMINKIVTEENPTYILVAFDKGKTFRHELYTDYKGGRSETPDELKLQFPIAKEVLGYMGIKYYECDNYEADDIIGTFSKFCENDDEWQATIISSDKDLLQLINNSVDIKLLKQKDYIRYNVDTFKEAYGFEPIKVIDLKALMGDPSDNIPGVKGIGEKTAIKLLNDFKSLDGIYNNLDKLTPKLKEKLETDKGNAYFSYKLATIITDVPISINMDDILYKGKNLDKLNKLYEDLEFYSFIKKEETKQIDNINVDVKIIDDINNIVISEKSAIYLEILGTNYHTSKVLGLAIYNNKESLFIPFNVFKENPNILKDKIKCTYDVKKLVVALKWQNIELDKIDFDTMIAGYLLDYNVKDDIAYLSNALGYNIPFYETIYGKNKFVEPSIEEIAKNSILKAKFIYDTYDMFIEKMHKEEVYKLFNEIEMPLVFVLADMEYTGVRVNKDTLKKMGTEIISNIKVIEQEIYELAGEGFNISSPKQLGNILFEKLGLYHGKKTQSGFSTSIEVLNKIKNEHPIINKIIDYRMLTKLYATYIEGLLNLVLSDGKIHTIFTQTLTRTGRLSSIEPNLQNIPIRNEYGRLIRKAFVPSNNSLILSADYSQIELRIFASISGVKSLIDAFNNNIDVHSKTASDIFKVNVDDVTKDMRRVAKTTNFGIIYGISSYGLSESLEIPVGEAKRLIDNYLETYPGIQSYMDTTISEAYKNGYVRTLLNRKRLIPELSNKNHLIKKQGERIALNTPIQGFSADIIKIAMIRIYDEFNKKHLKTKMVIQVHDELVFDVVENELDEVIKIVTDIMENVYTLDVPLKIAIEYGKDWYEAK